MTLFEEATIIAQKDRVKTYVVAKGTMMKVMRPCPQLLTDLRNGWELCGSYRRNKCTEKFIVEDENVIFELMDMFTMLTGKEFSIEDPECLILIFQEAFNPDGSIRDYGVKVERRYHDGLIRREIYDRSDAEQIMKILSYHFVEADKTETVNYLAGCFDPKLKYTRRA